MSLSSSPDVVNCYVLDLHRTGTKSTRCEVSHLYFCSAGKHSPTYNVHIVEYNGREVISRIYLS